jgi:DNA modification methylase
MTTDAQPYVIDTEVTDTWSMMLGDSCERLAELGDDSIDFTIYSPPFASLYVYSPSDRDLGNSASTAEFLEHYRFIINELMRVTKPGRLVAVHCAQIPTQKWRDGAIGLRDFRGDLIAAHTDAGFVFHGEATIDKDPQAQAIRTKSSSLLFISLERDGCAVRPALADYLLLFKVPGDNDVAVKPDCTREEWIEWARPIWPVPDDDGTEDAILATAGLQRAWYGIRETDTLNTAVAKEAADERHICPLQLPLIERCVRLWSNRGDTVLSPFAGIGSEGVGALRNGRSFVGIELKPSYWKVAVDNLRRAENEKNLGTLFDRDGEAS